MQHISICGSNTWRRGCPRLAWADGKQSARAVSVKSTSQLCAFGHSLKNSLLPVSDGVRGYRSFCTAASVGLCGAAGLRYELRAGGFLSASVALTSPVTTVSASSVASAGLGISLAVSTLPYPSRRIHAALRSAANHTAQEHIRPGWQPLWPGVIGLITVLKILLASLQPSRHRPSRTGLRCA